jgi:hypothetical protein
MAESGVAAAIFISDDADFLEDSDTIPAQTTRQGC